MSVERRRRDLPELALSRRMAPAPWMPGALAAAAVTALIAVLALGGWLALRPPAAGPPPALSIDIPPGTPPPRVPDEQRFLDIAPQDARALNARQPIVDPSPPVAAPYIFKGPSEALARAIDCLAAAAWYEAGDDPPGERAVVQVVVNRALNPAFPPSICRVVFQGSERSTGCQFTFTCDGSFRRSPSAVAWTRARAIAAAALSGAVDPRVGYATHYHTDWVVPAWRSSLDKIAQVGTHLFYRWRGFWGTPPAFRLRRSLPMTEPIVPPLAHLSVAHSGPGPALNLPAVAPDATAQAPSPSPPPPIAVDGVREKALHGAVVRGRTADRFFIQLDPIAFSGNYATTAVALCRGKTACAVLGWRDPAAMAVATPLSAAQTDALTFLYVRTDATTDHALWNCAQVERANKAQCLPADRGAILRLIG